MGPLHWQSSTLTNRPLLHKILYVSMYALGNLGEYTRGDTDEREHSKSKNKEIQFSNSYEVIENMWNVKIH